MCNMHLTGMLVAFYIRKTIIDANIPKIKHSQIIDSLQLEGHSYATML